MNRRRCLCLMAITCVVAVSITGCMTINPTNPRAMFTVSASRQVVPFTASFDATLSFVPTGDNVSYYWEFGDGGSATGPIVDHQFQSTGEYVVTLTVLDASGRRDTTSITVAALNPLPNATFTYSPRSVDGGSLIVGASEWITFDASESTDDGEIVSYRWYFGDGKEKEGKIVEYRWHVPGTYNVVLSVTDDAGDTSTTVQMIRVEGVPGGCYPWVCEDDPMGGCQ